MEEEAKCGQEFVVNVAMSADLSKACESDSLQDTIDYVVVYDLVVAEMQVRSKLIENVAFRIGKALKSEYPWISSGTVEVVKPNPPIGGDVDHVSVKIAF
jgi:dihydroneopterin aldolase